MKAYVILKEIKEKILIMRQSQLMNNFKYLL